MQYGAAVLAATCCCRRLATTATHPPYARLLTRTPSCPLSNSPSADMAPKKRAAAAKKTAGGRVAKAKAPAAPAAPADVPAGAVVIEACKS